MKVKYITEVATPYLSNESRNNPRVIKKHEIVD